MRFALLFLMSLAPFIAGCSGSNSKEGEEHIHFGPAAEENQKIGQSGNQSGKK